MIALCCQGKSEVPLEDAYQAKSRVARHLWHGPERSRRVGYRGIVLHKGQMRTSPAH